MQADSGAHMFAETTLYAHIHTPTGFAVTAMTGSSPVQLLVVAQIDYDISSSLIFLLIHSVTVLPSELYLQSQENLTEPSDWTAEWE